MSKLSFLGLLNQYVKEKPLSNATIQTYSGVVRGFTNDTGITHLANIDFEKLLDWRLSVIARSSDITWNNYLRHMRALWKFALKKNYVHNYDPFQELNWGVHKTTKKKTLSKRELKQILYFLSLEDCPFKPFWFWDSVVRFIYFTGLRRRQVVTLRWKDLDFRNKIICLSAQGDKINVEREIPVHLNLYDTLLSYRKIILNEFPYAYHPDKQIFNVTMLNEKYKKGMMTEEQLSGFFKRLSKHIGFPVSAHMLRHTMATEIAKSGKIKHLQQVLGHSNVRTTLDFYVHPNMADLHILVNELGDI